MPADGVDDPEATPEPGGSAQALYDDAPCALFSTLPDGEIVRANRTFIDWLGVAREDVIGRVRFPSLLTVGSRIYYETHYAPLLRMQGFVSEIALELRSPAGRVSPVVASAKQVRDESGAPVLIHVALFDSTDRRRYERELLEARKHAERASRALESADERKNEFIATLAHELRNPLAPLRAAVALQRREAGPDGQTRKIVDVMGRQVDQMVRLVEDLLDVSQLGRNTLSIRQQPVDLTALVAEASEASLPVLQSANVRLELRLPDSPLEAAVDAARVTQVIGNLLNNAAKFTPAGGTVTVTLERDGDDAAIGVRDDGIGIEREHLPQIFDMFMQARRTPERKGGLGIGLALSRSLIERHGGRLTAHSDGLGRGTEFRIRLPRAPGEERGRIADEAR
jgi:PAS domain S-box-containing protein